MKTVGIIAGLGSLAGAYFYERLIKLTPVKNDQEHIRTLLISDLAVPNRVGESLVELRKKMAELWKGEWCQNADGFVFACTETPLIQPALPPEIFVFSSVDLLAQAVIRFACEGEGLQNITTNI